MTRDFTIAVHTMLCIEFFKDAKTTSDFIAGSVGVNPVIIRNTLKDLREADLVVVKAGVGGAELARPAGEITLYDIYKAVGGTEKSNFGFHDNPNQKCPVGSRIHKLLDCKIDDANRAVEESLKKTTLLELVEKIRAGAMAGIWSSKKNALEKSQLTE